MVVKNTRYIGGSHTFEGEIEALGGVNNPSATKVQTETEKNRIVSHITKIRSDQMRLLLTEMGSDDWVTAAEKVTLERELERITSNYTVITSNFITWDLSTDPDYIVYSQIYNDLMAYLQPILAEEGSSSITKSEWTTKFNDYYTVFQGISDKSARIKTFIDSNSGYNLSIMGEVVGTLTPEPPVIRCFIYGRIATIDIFEQVTLTAPHTWEVQISDNQIDWYALGQDGTDWKQGNPGGFTTVKNTTFVHTGIPHVVPAEGNHIMGRTVNYRCRTRTTDLVSAWSDVVSGTTDPYGIKDIDVNALTANSAFIEELFANSITSESITADKIDTNGLTADSGFISNLFSNSITANSINADKINTPSLTADSGFINDLFTNTFGARKITGDEIAARTLTATNIIAGAITANEIDTDNLGADTGLINTLFSNAISVGYTGSITAGDVVIDSTGIDGPGFSLTSTTASLAGWAFDTGTLLSTVSGIGQIELSSESARISVRSTDGIDRVAMGYLDGLKDPRDGYISDLPAGTYGFWIGQSDSLAFYGDIDFQQGNMVLKQDANLQLVDGSGNLRTMIGTQDGYRGVHFYDATEAYIAGLYANNSSLYATSGIHWNAADIAVGDYLLSFGHPQHGIRKITNQSGLQISCDSSFVIHAGDHYNGYNSDLGITPELTAETLWLTADGDVKILSNWQNGISTAYQWHFANTGELYAPGAISINGYGGSDYCQLRLIYGDAAFMWRYDGTNLYLLKSDTAQGGYNTLRPFVVSGSAGNVSINTNLTVGGTLYADGDVSITGDTSISNLYATGRGRFYEGIGVGSSTAVNSTILPHRSFQLSTDTYFGGTYDGHSGFLMYTIMPGGWNTAELHFCSSTSWGTYDTGSPAMEITSEEIRFNTKTAFRTYDSWLRINDNAGFISGVYFGSSEVRTDANFTVGAAASRKHELSASGYAYHTGVVSAGGGLYFNNGALISNDVDGWNGDRTGTNIDHIWHEDATNTWHFCSDTTYKHTGNATLRANKVSLYNDGNMEGTGIYSCDSISLGYNRGGVGAVSIMLRDNLYTWTYAEIYKDINELKIYSGDTAINILSGNSSIILDADTTIELKAGEALYKIWTGADYMYLRPKKFDSNTTMQTIFNVLSYHIGVGACVHWYGNISKSNSSVVHDVSIITRTTSSTIQLRRYNYATVELTVTDSDTDTLMDKGYDELSFLILS